MWALASSFTFAGKNQTINMAEMMIKNNPPITSPPKNTQPNRETITINISNTRLVLATINATAFDHVEPLIISVRAIDAAAYEQDEETAPKKVDSPTEATEFVPSREEMVSVETKALTTEERIKPSASPQ
ncbi:hypothetical protein GALL_535800 [mine drainage metagenome]|uniref:Uncharacterized protein n=1 Tax=mine drainage metagenome TaxID=410659 RepID=A0A1J5PBK6_9ZZZZ